MKTTPTFNPEKISADIRSKKKNGSGETTANETIITEDTGGKKWVLKKISAEEALTEAVTGQIYRYLIGGHQPRTYVVKIDRVAYNLASEFIPFMSFRDALTTVKTTTTTDNLKKYKTAFLNDLQGFTAILIASMFLEENDLSDANYGLTTTGIGDFGPFIKIDHGQSLNSLRIARHIKPLALAPVKCYPPIPDDNLKDGFDLRMKEERSESFNKNVFKAINNVVTGNAYPTTRSYKITRFFFEHCLSDFFDNKYTEDRLIKGINPEGTDLFFPSTFPLYDYRLKPFINGKSEALEHFKILSAVKIILTSDKIYNAICDDAAENHLYKEEVRKKIIERKKMLFYTVLFNYRVIELFSAPKLLDAIEEDIEVSCGRVLAHSYSSDYIDNEIGNYFTFILHDRSLRSAMGTLRNDIHNLLVEFKPEEQGMFKEVMHTCNTVADYFKLFNAIYYLATKADMRANTYCKKLSEKIRAFYIGAVESFKKANKNGEIWIEMEDINTGGGSDSSSSTTTSSSNI